MTFSSALSNAVSGMNAAQLAIQVRGHNVANALTPGYARRDVVLDVRAPSGGVIVSEVARADAGRIGALALSAGAAEAEAGERAEAAGALNLLLGEPGDEEGLYAAYARLESALADLSATPESASYQAAALGTMSRLTGTFNRIGDAAQSLRTQADRDLAAGVAEVNRATRELHALNGRRAEGLSDLPEQRQRLIDTIGTYMDVDVRTDERGRVSIATGAGVPLLTDRPHEVAFAPGGVVTAGQSIDTGHLSGLSLDGIELTPGLGPQALRTGRLVGMLAVRDEVAPGFADRIDALAEDLVARFAEDAVDPSKPAGADGLFTAAPGAGAASRIAVNAAIDPAQGGATFRIRDGIGASAPGPSAAAGVLPSLLAALGAPRAVPGASGGPAAMSASGLVEAATSAVGTARLSADVRAASTGATAEGLRRQALSATGVNTDAELQQLLLIEQAYAANARVLQTVDAMMNRLLEI